MHHVRVAEDDVRTAADGAPGVLRRIAVVCEDADFEVSPRETVDRTAMQFRELILRERLRRKHIQRTRRWILQDRAQDWRVVTERLAGCGRRRDDDVPAIQGVFNRGGLVRVELLNAAIPERGS